MLVTIHTGRIAEELQSGTVWDVDTSAANRERDRDSAQALAGIIGFVEPEIGGLLSVLTALSSGGPPQETNPTHPDSRLEVSWSEDGVPQRLVSDRFNNNVRPVWDFEFLVRASRVEQRGIDVRVDDDDGPESDASFIGEIAIPPSELHGVLTTGRPVSLTFSDHELLDVVVRIRAVTREEVLGRAHGSLALANGAARIGSRIPARSTVRVSASGEGRVGTGFRCPGGVDVFGLPDGMCASYNLHAGSLASAPHGSAVVLFGREPNLGAFSLAEVSVVDPVDPPCAEFITPTSGVLVVGVNDNNFQNNSGEFEFDLEYGVPPDDLDVGTAAGVPHACAADRAPATSGGDGDEQWWD